MTRAARPRLTAMRERLSQRLNERLGRVMARVAPAARLARELATGLLPVLDAGRDRTRRLRLEPFGAIVQLVTPRALVFVDRDRARSLGATPDLASEVWRDPADDGQVGRTVLSAPLEAHLQLTNRCDAGCRGCYTGATPAGAANEQDLAAWKRSIDELAAMGVFHVALGGGESAILPWLGELADHARARGLVPNLTTSGLSGLENLLDITDRFGQINVSLDGLGDAYAAVRGFDGFARAQHAIRALRARKREIGINVVITRHNFDQIDELFAYARSERLNEVELLRFKPAGRGARAFTDLTCSDAQHRGILPAVLAACRRRRVRARVDC
jgi:pyruvate-formate lyase-activating enzyme